MYMKMEWIFLEGWGEHILLVFYTEIFW